MAERVPLYVWSLENAIRNGERDLWRESHKENCNCARVIERTISENYHDNVLHDCVRPIIDQYGFDRVNFVLANTVQQKKEDGRFSENNKQWARSIHIPRDDNRWHFTVESHPGLTNLFINDARKEWQSLGLFDYSHCISEDGGQIDYTGKVVVLKPTTLKDEYKTPEGQLFFAKHGNGCRPSASGTKVYGFHLDNGEEGYYRRYDIIGAIKDEYLPDWAKENFAKFSNIETQNDAESPTEDGGIAMGGM